MNIIEIKKLSDRFDLDEILFDGENCVLKIVIDGCYVKFLTITIPMMHANCSINNDDASIYRLSHMVNKSLKLKACFSHCIALNIGEDNICIDTDSMIKVSITQDVDLVMNNVDN